ncbi:MULTISPECIES: KOW motif-containing protein [unclassified Sphingomonas]|uniref:KOW motif-containing protein n=1 Tax=unclassified Sphingomonas TaxID=196159 RepID=UPI00215117E8|nr:MULTISPECIES: KOW motif-containing protein [unclassified Sphingomonas]MCR5870111.1 KOW motif-containing protein [Sphingomonas sp. J344]UUX98197.1 KOW motif-containing protein [Sphingomonas sp. J315]
MSGVIGNGDACEVVDGRHKGRAGTVEDVNTSKTGSVTITVREGDGTRFKTLLKSVRAPV